MSIKRITAIVPIGILKSLEEYLRECDVPGVTVERVQGYGEHPNYFRRDLMQDNARVVLYVNEQEVERIVAATVRCAHECGAMAGVLVVEGIDRLVNLSAGADLATAPL